MREIAQGFVSSRGFAATIKEWKVHVRTWTEDPRDPEDREIDESNATEKKDKMMDKTVADTFPASDPSSSLPDPDEDSFAARECNRTSLSVRL